MTKGFQNFLELCSVLDVGGRNSPTTAALVSAVDSEAVGELDRGVRSPILISPCSLISAAGVKLSIIGVILDFFNDADDLNVRRVRFLNRTKGLVLEVFVVGADRV